MTGLEYTDRLVENINSTSRTRIQVMDPFEQIKVIGLSGTTNLKDFNKSLGVWDVDSHLDILSQFINSSKTLVNHKKGDKIDISVWQTDVSKNKERIGEIFQQIIDNNDLIDLNSRKPISEFLIEQLEWINKRVSE